MLSIIISDHFHNNIKMYENKIYNNKKKFVLSEKKKVCKTPKNNSIHV